MHINNTNSQIGTPKVLEAVLVALTGIAVALSKYLRPLRIKGTRNLDVHGQCTVIYNDRPYVFDYTVRYNNGQRIEQ